MQDVQTDPSTLTIGIVSPGAMGSALGRAWVAAGARVVATVAGRSARTRELAHGLELRPDQDAVLAEADLICSVLPPGRALDVATELAQACLRLGVAPVYADLNAIAPDTVQQIQATVTAAGCEFLDGSISGGPPPRPDGATWLYLAGRSTELLDQLDAPGVRTIVVGDRPGSASAVKMSTASIYKGLSGLLSQALQSAEFYGVTGLVLTDLARGLPDYVSNAAREVAAAASKSDRYPDEMRQIAIAQGAAGAEPALFDAMAQVYEAIHRSALARLTPEQVNQSVDLSEVLRLLADR